MHWINLWVMFFDVDCFSPETINKYCYMCVTSREATVTSTERDLHGFGIDYRFRLTCGRHQWSKHRFLNHMYLKIVLKETFIEQSASVIGALLRVLRCIQDYGLRAINAKMCARVQALEVWKYCTYYKITIYQRLTNFFYTVPHYNLIYQAQIFSTCN